MFRSRTLFKLCILAATGLASSAAMAQSTFDEATFNPEPNNTKAAATSVVTIGVAGDKLTGACLTSDADYWHLKMAPLAAGIYRNVLTVTAPTSGTFTHTIRGLNQAAGVIGTTDTAVFTSSVPTTSGRSVSWVGFGKQEELFYSISHSATTATNYTVTYARAAITPIDMTATSLNAGPITIRVHNVSGSLNTDCWLYDANLNPLINDSTAGPAGADGALVTTGGGTGTILSSFTRTLPAGVYYLAIGGSNLANTQPSVAADTTGNNSPVLELPNALVCGVSTGAAATFYADFVDSATPTAHTVTSTNIVLAANWGGNVNFVKINVIQPFLPSGTLSSNPTPAVPGTSTILSIAATPSTGGASADITTVTADISALTGNTSPDTLTLTSSNGGVTWTGTAPVAMATTMGNKTIPFTIVEGGSVPGTLNSSGSVTVGPVNDVCSGAIAVTPGTPSSPIDNQFAGTNDGPTACAAGGKGIWYKVTPTVDASYQVDTCGSAANTLLTVYQLSDCSNTATWTQVGCNDDRPAGTCTEAQTSAIQGLGLLAGTTYYLRVESFNNSGTFITGSVVVNVSQTGTVGACCSNVTGACSFTSPDACPATTSGYLGDGTSCSPFPCTVTGTCCNNSTGACTTLGPTGTCTAGTINGSMACSPTPCLVSGTCCNNTTGLCATIYGGSCASGSIVGSGTVCNASACIAVGTCCNTTSGACTAIFGGNCPTGASAGSGTVCNASACVAVGTCCNTSSGACTSLYSGSCSTGTNSNASLTCTPTPCTPAGICCSSSGICTVNYGATCTGLLNTTVTVCGPSGAPNSACPPQGICCLFASGSCTVTYSGGCVSNAAFHTDTTCSAGTPSATCAPYATSTCCSSTGVCTVIFGGTCAGASGINGTTCSAGTPSPSCAPTGICCNNSSGACVLIFSGSCGTGTTAGSGSSCGTGACPVTGACCDSLTGYCRLIYGGSCPSGSQAGAAGTACNAAACPPVGSCCDNFTGACVLNFSFCPGNSTSNASLVCTPTPCLPAQSWACCLPDASCRATTQDDCAAYAGNWAPGLACGSFVCSPTNLVVNPGAETSDLSGWTITGSWSATFDGVVHSGYRSFSTGSSLGTRTQTINLVAHGYSAGVLDAIPPIVVGDWIASRADDAANYFVKFDILDSAQAVLDTYSHGSSTALIALAAGTPFFQESHIFTGYPTGARFIKITEAGRDQNGWAGFYAAHFDDTFAGVVILQACCLAGGSCVVEDMATCLDAGGTRTNTATCTASTCGQSGGVCCRGATCNTNVAAANCTGNSLAGAIHSASASCNAGGSTTTPCCYPDYNKTGGITVGDIFDFLNDWFAGSSYANVGGDGNPGTLAVQNIFDFLNAWFAGGCS